MSDIDDFASAFDEAVSDKSAEPSAPAPTEPAAPVGDPLAEPSAASHTLPTEPPDASHTLPTEPAAPAPVTTGAEDFELDENAVPPAAPAVTDPPKDPPKDLPKDPPAPATLPAETSAPPVAADPPKDPPAPAPAAPPAESTPEPTFDAPYEMSDEDKHFLTKTTEEWPDVIKAAEIIAAQRIHATEQAMMKRMYDFGKAVAAVITPIATKEQETAQEKHINAVREVHKDYDQRVGELPAWIEKQPAPLKLAYQEIYNRGTTEEVVQMFNTYKLTNGIPLDAAPTAEPPPAPAPTAPPAKPTPSPAEVAALKPVASMRQKVGTGAPDASNFDAAWDEANT